MKKILILGLIILLSSFVAFADTIFLKDGTRLDVEKTWEEDGKVKYNLYGTVYSYPKDQVQKIEKSKIPKSAGSNIDNYPVEIRSALPKEKDKVYELTVTQVGEGYTIEGKAVVKNEILSFMENLEKHNPNYKFEILEDKYLGVAERKFALLASPQARRRVVQSSTPQKSTGKDRARQGTASPFSEYRGNGDDVISISTPGSVALLKISGNRAGRHFSVKGYDRSGNSTGLFVNTTDSYDGIVLAKATISQLEISAHGPWIVEVYEVKYATGFDIPGMKEGSGDSVLKVLGTAQVMEVNGNPGGRHFSIMAHHKRGAKLLVNTTEPYHGKVRFPAGTILLEIGAKGRWMLNAK